MGIASSRRFATLLITGGLLVSPSAGCRLESHDPVRPFGAPVPHDAPEPSVPRPVSPILQLRLAAVEDSVLPPTARVQLPTSSHRLGPASGWSACLRLEPGGPWLLRVEPLSFPAEAERRPRFYPVTWASWAVPVDSLVLPLVPRLRLHDSVYREALDLLQEFIQPFSGSRIRRWARRSLRVALPAGEWPVDYRGPCLEAISHWNEVLREDVFMPVDPGVAAEVTCEVSEEARLAYTRLTDSDGEGRPLAMRIHLSPRWTAGSERYVRRVYVHELGHALGLWGHSLERLHILNGQAVVVDTIHRDEARVARWFWRLPADFDLVALGRPGPSPDLPPGQPFGITRCRVATERGTVATRPE